MIPTSPNFVTSNKKTIYINPNFSSVRNELLLPYYMSSRSTSAHINPNFLHGQQRKLPAIHMNPQFLQQKLFEEQEKLQNIQPKKTHTTIAANLEIQPQKVFQKPTVANYAIDNSEQATIKQSVHTVSPIVQNRKIISKTRLRLVREPATIDPPSTESIADVVHPLIKLSKRKLIRKVVNSANSITVNHAIVAKKRVEAVKAAKNKSTHGKYKIDKRLLNTTILKTKYKYNKQSSKQNFSLRRDKYLPLIKSEISASIMPFKRKLLSSNKSLKLYTINGVLYKSTKNKLQRNDIKTVHSTKSKNTKSSSSSINAIERKPKTITEKQHTLIIHGTKYVMDTKGVKLTRIPTNITSLAVKNTPSSSITRQRSRIDIGGLTYVASKTKNVLVRTRNHLALAHLAIARQRSLQLLTRNFVKSNIPCAIYQRIGKCLAFERGKCSKVHDKRQVTICPRFLRGDCRKTNCLLSHNVSLAKMPVCKFFLQGVCVRDDCPYLHKKLSKKTEICADFLRGYCLLAEKCNKRHEFLCPEYERNGKCDITNCVYCKNKLWQDTALKKKTEAAAALKKKAPQKIEKNVDLIAENKQQNDETIEMEMKEKENSINVRYFNETVVGKPRQEEENTNTIRKPVIENENNEVEEKASILTQSVTHSILARRPKVGDLPAFIPLS